MYKLGNGGAPVHKPKLILIKTLSYEGAEKIN